MKRIRYFIKTNNAGGKYLNALRHDGAARCIRDVSGEGCGGRRQNNCVDCEHSVWEYNQTWLVKESEDDPDWKIEEITEEEAFLEML